MEGVREPEEGDGRGWRGMLRVEGDGRGEVGW